MTQRYGRNQRRRHREALAAAQAREVVAIGATRVIARELAECRFALERARAALLHARDDFPARAIGVEGPFRDDVPLDTAIKTIVLSGRG